MMETLENKSIKYKIPKNVVFSGFVQISRMTPAAPSVMEFPLLMEKSEVCSFI